VASRGVPSPWPHTDGLPPFCMLAAAFHVGRAELLQWINGLLGLRYTKVEQCANGAAYCMILNATFQARALFLKHQANSTAHAR